MKSLYPFLIIILLISKVSAQVVPVQSYHLVKSENAVQYKNYYLLTLLQEIPTVKEVISKDDSLKRFLQQKTAQVNSALKQCNADVHCYAGALKFSEGEIIAIGARLENIYKSQPALANLVKQHLIPSGCYSNTRATAPQDLLVKAWEQDAKAINYAIGVYVEGNKPNYPKIDSISFQLKDKEFIELTSLNAGLALNNNQLFFEPAMNFALGALELNTRKDAADFEPMETTVNKAAFDQIKKTDWKKYPYSVILVPGAGPEDEDTELSAGGMIRCRLAAIQYKKGLAPFIVVSGGRVHPYKTRFSEALEMKKFLMQTLSVPESAIIMEPHARHTTTNMRNCARLMFRYGMPFDKPGITSTVKSQSLYITELVNERSKKELGYYPYKNGKRLSDTEAEFYPSSLSLQIDFDESLDP